MRQVIAQLRLGLLERVAQGSLICFCVVLLCACGGSLGSALDAYDRADYPHAARQFRQAASEGINPQDTARFHLYCGLNHLALGNARLAIVHLSQARSTLDRNTTYFTLAERARLLTAWRSLGRMPGQSLVD